MLGRAGLRALVLAVMLPATPAAAGSLWELNFYLSGPRYDGVLPACDARAALDKVAARFSQKEGTFWNSDLTIEAFAQVQETSYRSWAPNTIPRRFCAAVVQLSDGRRHPIYYSMAEDTGMIGMTFGVEWCVVGLDRNWSYNPGCKMARP